ncbi:copper resistance CopC family protein [Paraburkholderia solisilvae]|uniref:Protein YobA n=1 Tax=Paraburkholderia solisilvae TaxID=624376 RepID=A0A6J5DTQ2_9BURK|nr:copper resistance protein CopC [Paraburkholderia solisilvae]CAB3756235.1 Protein YobA [Paraburkholderia solisilvae]
MNASLLRGFAAALTLAASQLAHAHAFPTREAPSAGAIVPAGAHVDVVIDFDEPVEPAFSSIIVSDGKGETVTKSKSLVNPTNHRRMSVALNALVPGVYAVAWTAIANDGHRTQGHYTFTVG